MQDRSLMKTVCLFIGLLSVSFSFGQDIKTRLNNSLKLMESDEQFKHALVSLYVIDGRTGALVFEKNPQVGLAPASCQKVITGITAFELLGKGYRYQTGIAYEGNITNGILSGNIYLIPSGDPTLGSWRWASTSVELIELQILAALKRKNIREIHGDIILDDSKWETQATPRGWIWEDVGNYYGAGARGLNWHENQYDLLLHPGKNEGDSVQIISTRPELQIPVLINELKTGKRGSGDNSVIYLPEQGLIGYLRGTVPAGKDTFVVSGSIPDVAGHFLKTIEDLFGANGITLKGRSRTATYLFYNKEQLKYSPVMLDSILSPTFDSINYWFLKKSINLYGEALVKTIAYEKAKFGSTDTGLNLIKDFWNKRGIERSALNIIDGSGLSPCNRVTTHALVTVMQYARNQDWFPSFYHALPEQNGLKMKDGYINGVRSFTGYVKSKNGHEYTFSFIVNNFIGNAGNIRDKMWELLNILK